MAGRKPWKDTTSFSTRQVRMTPAMGSDDLRDALFMSLIPTDCILLSNNKHRSGMPVRFMCAAALLRRAPRPGPLQLAARFAPVCASLLVQWGARMARTPRLARCQIQN